MIGERLGSDMVLLVWFTTEDDRNHTRARKPLGSRRAASIFSSGARLPTLAGCW